MPPPHNDIWVARDILPLSGRIGFLLECREDANDAVTLQEKGKEKEGKEGVADAGDVIDEEAGEGNGAEGGREKHDEPHVIDFLADDVAHGPVVDCRLEEVTDKSGVGGCDVAKARDEEPVQQEIRRCCPDAAVHDVTRLFVVVEDVGVEVVVDLEKHAGNHRGNDIDGFAVVMGCHQRDGFRGEENQKDAGTAENGQDRESDFGNGREVFGFAIFIDERDQGGVCRRPDDEDDGSDGIGHAVKCGGRVADQAGNHELIRAGKEMGGEVVGNNRQVEEKRLLPENGVPVKMVFPGQMQIKPEINRDERTFRPEDSPVKAVVREKQDTEDGNAR